MSWSSIGIRSGPCMGARRSSGKLAGANFKSGNHHLGCEHCQQQSEADLTQSKYKFDSIACVRAGDCVDASNAFSN